MGPAWYVRHMLLDLTEPEKDALLTLVMEAIEAAPPSPQTDLLHGVLAKLGADTAADPVDPATPLDEAVLTTLRGAGRTSPTCSRWWSAFSGKAVRQY